MTVTDQRTVVRQGILAKHTNEVYHEHVRNIRLSQSLLKRLFNVGSLQIASAGSASHEISVAGSPRLSGDQGSGRSRPALSQGKS